MKRLHHDVLGDVVRIRVTTPPMQTVAVRPGAPDVALLPSSRLGRSMPELLCHPIPFVMRRVVYDLRRPRAGGCERRTRENSAYIFERWEGVVGCRSELRSGSEELVARGVAGGMGGRSWLKNSALLGVKHIFITRGARRDCMILRWWGEVDERARARGHTRLRAHEHGRVVRAHSIFFELRRKGVAGHRPRALLVWGVPHLHFLFCRTLGRLCWLVLQA